MQDISEEDAIAEGVKLLSEDGYTIYNKNYRSAFRVLWNGINKKRGFSFESNPWVWKIELEVMK